MFNSTMYYFILFLNCWFDKVIFYCCSPWSPVPRIQVTEDRGSKFRCSKIEIEFAAFSLCGQGSQNAGHHFPPFSLLRKKEVMRNSLLLTAV